MNAARITLCVAALVLVPGCRGSGRNRPTVERAANAAFAPRPQGPSQPRQAPDLAFRNLKWGNLGLPPGGTSTVELDVVNHGAQAAGPFRVAVYVSPGSVITANRTLVGSAELGSLAGGMQHVVVTITAPSTPGSFAIGVELDDQLRVAGDDRANNKSGPSRLYVK